MSNQYRTIPDKLIRVRTHDGTQHFWHANLFRGIRRVSGNYVEIYFGTMLRQEGGGGSGTNATNEIDVVKIRFEDVQGGAWGSIIKMWEEIMTGKSIVFTIADTYADPPFYNLQAGEVKRNTAVQAGSWDLGPEGDGSSYYGETTSPNLNETDLNLTVVVVYREEFDGTQETYP